MKYIYPCFLYGEGPDVKMRLLFGEYVRYLDAIYFNDNSTQSLIRSYLTLSLAKTQGSLSSANTQGSIHVRINQRILLN